MSFPWYSFGNVAAGRTTGEQRADNGRTTGGQRSWGQTTKRRARVWGANYAPHGDFVPWRARVTAIQAFVAPGNCEHWLASQQLTSSRVLSARAKSSRFCTSAHCLLSGSQTRGFASRLDAPFLSRIDRVIPARALTAAADWELALEAATTTAPRRTCWRPSCADRVAADTPTA